MEETGEVMEQITIPRSIEAAQEELGAIAELLTAKEWKRAAIVYAFTTDGLVANQYARSTSTTGMSPREFAGLGIAGLKSDTTVRDYRRAWQTAIDDGQAVAIKPGDKVILPSRGWPPNPKQHTSTPEEVVARVRNNPDVVREILADPVASAVVHEAISRDLRHVSAVNDIVRTKNADYVERHASPVSVDYDAVIVSGVDALMRGIQAEQRGEWTPNATSTMLLHFVSRLLVERSEPQGVPSSLFDEIDSFLAKEAAR
jgi:hypothetical protein